MQTRPENSLILVVAEDGDIGSHLKELLEFMDAPEVEVSSADDWQSQIGERRLSAIFCAPGLKEEASQRVIGEVREIDPNVSIVIVGPESATAEPS